MHDLGFAALRSTTGTECVVADLCLDIGRCTRIWSMTSSLEARPVLGPPDLTTWATPRPAHRTWRRSPHQPGAVGRRVTGTVDRKLPVKDTAVTRTATPITGRTGISVHHASCKRCRPGPSHVTSRQVKVGRLAVDGRHDKDCDRRPSRHARPADRLPTRAGLPCAAQPAEGAHQHDHQSDHDDFNRRPEHVGRNRKR